jgi:hypothetical protein
MKLELSLTESEHRYLLEANSHDRSFRSLQAFAKDCLLDGLNCQAAEYLGTTRREATAALVAAGKAAKPKRNLVTR